MANSLSVKAYMIPEDFHGKDEIRRFTLDANVTSNFLYLREKLMILFPVLQRRPFTVLYKDEEGDMITVSCDEELATACLSSGKDKLLRINIKRDRNGHQRQQRHSKHEGSPNSEAENEVNNVIHPRITCDGCEGPIFGFRYKCVQCPDYDLCMGCEFKQKHAQHLMMRIPTPDAAYPMNMPGGHERHGSHRRHHWGHRRRHGGPFGAARKSTEGDGSDEGPSDQEKFQYPFQFNQVLEKIWTTLGGLPRETAATAPPTPSTPLPTEGKMGANNNARQNENAHDEYLHKVGSTVAAMLDPLGIDVDFHVTKDEVRQPETKPTEKEAAKDSYSNASTVNLVNPEQFKVTEPTAAVIKEESLEKMLYPSLAQDIAKATEKIPETGEGWMYVDVNAKEPSFRPSADEESQHPKSVGPPTTSIANELNSMNLASSPYPINPTIRSALEQMVSMGFSNEGGWLAMLLEVKNGNIDEVLEVLSPHSKTTKIGY